MECVCKSPNRQGQKRRRFNPAIWRLVSLAGEDALGGPTGQLQDGQGRIGAAGRWEGCSAGDEDVRHAMTGQARADHRGLRIEAHTGGAGWVAGVAGERKEVVALGVDRPVDRADGVQRRGLPVSPRSADERLQGVEAGEPSDVDLGTIAAAADAMACLEETEIVSDTGTRPQRHQQHCPPATGVRADRLRHAISRSGGCAVRRQRQNGRARHLQSRSFRLSIHSFTSTRPASPPHAPHTPLFVSLALPPPQLSYVRAACLLFPSCPSLVQVVGLLSGIGRRRRSSCSNGIAIGCASKCARN